MATPSSFPTYSPEPWSFSEESSNIISDLAPRDIVAIVPFGNSSAVKEKARKNGLRIVRCVNACKGISTTDLKGLSVQKLLNPPNPQLQIPPTQLAQLNASGPQVSATPTTQSVDINDLKRIVATARSANLQQNDPVSQVVNEIATKYGI